MTGTVRQCLRAGLLAVTFAATAQAAPPPAAIAGRDALPSGEPKVAATLAVVPARHGTQPAAAVLDVAMTRLGDTRPITRYDVELGKRMHLIAISDDFRTFLHEHAERPGVDGHFRIPLSFPRRGAWHVYADATPAGLGQQVMRFDISLDPPDSDKPDPPAPQPSGLTGSDGRYGVRFDALDLKAGQETPLTLHILRDGKPAPDLTPFLGVAAHAVFIAAADLSYIHVHAAPVATGAMHHHEMAGVNGMEMPGMDAAPLRPGARVPPDLALHVLAPTSGTYLLWLQFTAGGHVRTVPFAMAVA